MDHTNLLSQHVPHKHHEGAARKLHDNYYNYTEIVNAMNAAYNKAVEDTTNLIIQTQKEAFEIGGSFLISEEDTKYLKL